MSKAAAALVVPQLTTWPPGADYPGTWLRFAPGFRPWPRISVFKVILYPAAELAT